MDMEQIRICDNRDTELVTELIHKTIRKCYPEIYPPEVVTFFIDYHSVAQVNHRINEGVVFICESDGMAIGTGFLHGEEMGGLYIHPDHQRKGVGEMLVRRLMSLAREKQQSRIWLDATPLAKPLYDKLGFRLISPMTDWVNDVPLHYFKMELILNQEK